MENEIVLKAMWDEESKKQAVATLKAMLEKERKQADSVAAELESMEGWLVELQSDLKALMVAIDELESVPDPVPPPIEPVPTPSPSRMGIGYHDNGWTKFEINKTVTVRSDGTAMTLNEAHAAIEKDPQIDCVLIDGGVTFTGQWRLSGASRERPIVFMGRQEAEITGLWSDKPLNNLAFVSTDLIGASFNQPGENLLLETVSFSHHLGDGLVIQGERPHSLTSKRWRNVSIRFCKCLDNWRPDRKAQGLFMTGVDDWLIEYSIFHGNGWDSSVPRQSSEPAGGAQLLSHNVYVGQPSGPGIVHHNIFSAPASHGIHMRPGGLLEQNLFLNCPIAWQFGYHYPSDREDYPDYGQVGGGIFNNVALGSDDIRSNPRGVFGILSHVKGVRMNSNYAINNQTSSTNNLLLWFDRARFDQAKFEDVDVEGTYTYGWSPSIRDLPASGVRVDAPSIHELDELADRDALLMMHTHDDFINDLMGSPWLTRAQFEGIMGDPSRRDSVWGRILKG